MTLPDPVADRLIVLLTQQRDLYRELEGLAKRQRELISGQRPERLIDVLRERQGLVGRLAQLNVELAPYRRDWSTACDHLSPAARQEAQDLLDEINRLLRVILDTDREDSSLLAARKAAAGAELRTMGSSQAAAQAYAKQRKTAHSDSNS